MAEYNEISIIKLVSLNLKIENKMKHQDLKKKRKERNSLFTFFKTN